MASSESVTLADDSIWATSLSCTRVDSLNDCSLQRTLGLGNSVNLQSLLRVVKNLNLRQIPYASLQHVNLIEEGSTFSVSKCRWQSGFVAVKHLKRTVSGDLYCKDVLKQQLQSVFNEILAMHHGTIGGHPNIVSLIGYGWRVDGVNQDPYMVVEYASLGTLRHFLRNQARCSLKDKISLIGDVAAGLTKLHKNGMIHGDLKLENVVVFPSQSQPCGYIAKLCDFSHAIPILPQNCFRSYRGTPLYLPPEALEQTQSPIPMSQLHKCDMWTFGLALWEILIDGKVYFQRDWRNDIEYRQQTAGESFHSCLSHLETPSSEQAESHRNSQLRSCGSCFGCFDLRNLQALSREVVQKVCPAQSFERGYLDKLLVLLLHPEPGQRISDLTKWPIMHGRYATTTSSSSNFQDQLTRYSLHTDYTFDIFRPDRYNNILWKHQVQIVEDLQAAVDDKTNACGPAAFQLMACHALGFGTEINMSKANHNLQLAVTQGLRVTQIFGGHLTESFVRASSTCLKPYEARIVQAFHDQRAFDRSNSVYLCTHPTSDVEGESLNLGCVPLINPSAVLELAQQTTHLPRKVIISDTFLCNSNSATRVTWLEFAILENDIHLLDLCCGTTPSVVLEELEFHFNTPLILACQRGRSAMVRTLLSWSSEPTRSTKDGQSILHWLFCLGEDAVAVLDLLVPRYQEGYLKHKLDEICQSAFTIDAQWPTEITGTPLAFAVTSGNRALVERLLYYGADPFVQFTPPALFNGAAPAWTPIHLAVKYNFVDILQTLLRNTPSKHLHSKSTALKFKDFQLASALSFLTPIERFGIHGAKSQAQLLATTKMLTVEALEWQSLAGTTPLWQAIDFGNVEVAKALLQCSPKLASIPNKTLSTLMPRTLPLHYATYLCAQRNSYDTYLMPNAIYWAFPNAMSSSDDQGCVPLHYSVASRFSVITEWLVSMGCPVDATNKMGQTPLMLCGSAANSRALLDAGADIDIEDINGTNSGHHAAARTDDDSLQLLISRGVKLNKIDKLQGTVLHYAVAGSSTTRIAQLLSSGGCVDLCSLQGQTPLHIAVESQRLDVVDLLLCNSASPTMVDTRGISAIGLEMRRISGLSKIESNDQFEMFQGLLKAVASDGPKSKKQKNMATVLHDCAKEGDLDLMKYLLTYIEKLSLDTTVDQMDPKWMLDGKTVLHSAAEVANTGTAKALFEKGMSCSWLKSKNGNTPLMTVCQSDSDEEKILQFVDLLLRHDAGLLVQNEQNQTAWTLAHSKLKFPLLARILEAALPRDIQQMLIPAPITWHLLTQALRHGHTHFVCICLTHSRHIPFLQDRSVLLDISAALDCPINNAELDENNSIFMDNKCVPLNLQYMLKDHADLVLDALRGKSVVSRLRERQVELKLEFQGICWVRNGSKDKVGHGKGADWVSERIRAYLDLYEPDGDDEEKEKLEREGRKGDRWWNLVSLVKGRMKSKEVV